jgi:hypothetical protein
VDEEVSVESEPGDGENGNWTNPATQILKTENGEMDVLVLEPVQFEFSVFRIELQDSSNFHFLRRE